MRYIHFAIAETLGLDTAPRIILQTHPVEHSVVANNCTIDIHGWAEPGTSLMINKNQEVPVAPDSVFFACVRPSRTGTVSFKAKDTKASKVCSSHSSARTTRNSTQNPAH